MIKIETSELKEIENLKNALSTWDQLRLYTKSREIKDYMPGIDSYRFSILENQTYRKSVILELATYSAEILAMQYTTKKLKVSNFKI